MVIGSKSDDNKTPKLWHPDTQAVTHIQDNQAIKKVCRNIQQIFQHDA
jgi:hypothetical protein